MFEKQSRRTGLDREVGGFEERAQTQSLRAQARWHRQALARRNGTFRLFANSPEVRMNRFIISDTLTNTTVSSVGLGPDQSDP